MNDEKNYAENGRFGRPVNRVSSQSGDPAWLDRNSVFSMDHARVCATAATGPSAYGQGGDHATGQCDGLGSAAKATSATDTHAALVMTYPLKFKFHLAPHLQMVMAYVPQDKPPWNYWALGISADEALENLRKLIAGRFQGEWILLEKAA